MPKSFFLGQSKELVPNLLFGLRYIEKIKGFLRNRIALRVDSRGKCLKGSAKAKVYLTLKAREKCPLRLSKRVSPLLGKCPGGSKRIDPGSFPRTEDTRFGRRLCGHPNHRFKILVWVPGAVRSCPGHPRTVRSYPEHPGTAPDSSGQLRTPK